MNKLKPNFEGIEIGAVSVKWVRRSFDQTTVVEIRRHEGNPGKVVREILDSHKTEAISHIVATGQAASSFLDLAYCSETECIEKALRFHDLKPDILLSLGGETFSVYPLKNGRIKNIISSSKCAAGTGEFMVQQFQRMGLSREQGLEASLKGKMVQLATRCSVHCKSDATHKLNKGECTPGDISKSLIFDLAKKVGEMVEMAQWPVDSIVIAGGVARNNLFVENFRGFFKDSQIHVLPESPYFEAFGAALHAQELSNPNRLPLSRFIKTSELSFETLKPLNEAEHLLDYRVHAAVKNEIKDGGTYLLGVDAGSTTIKAVLLNAHDLSVGASCYLRTLGDPVSTVKKCLNELIDQVGEKSIKVIQAGTTGSGREMVSVYLNNCPSFNEILAHARATAHEVPDVDTVFEIGGQDSKFISFLNGIPVDYAMNEGCSAGTGSFLEESASVDMGVSVKEISNIAERSLNPISFGERCAAFINTDLRNALQQGASREDVIAGLVYSIADNYISRIVGSRHIGEKLLFLGGVALNKSVALAMAFRTQQKLVVPPHPELMGSVGTALMVKDLLHSGAVPKKPIDLRELISGEIEVKGTFHCKACDNICEIQKVKIRNRSFPFGGLCSKYEMQRHGKDQKKEGRDLIAVRNKMLFDDFGPQPLEKPRGTIGLPMALSTFELFPFYARLINELGYTVVPSKPSKAGNAKSTAAICYPCEIVHGAVHDLLVRDVDFIFLPHVIELKIPEDNLHSYTCPSTTAIPDIIRAAFGYAGNKILSPHISLSEDHIDTTLKEIEKLGTALGLDGSIAKKAGNKALLHYEKFKEKYREVGQKELEMLAGEPAVIVAGRPYTVCSPEVNLALPRKIASRGYHVIPVDMLPQLNESSPKRNVWHFTQQVNNAVSYVNQYPNFYICLVSCFSCGPDSSIYHAFRESLAGHTFCYLEIDSHTAHAGFETRIGAFLDIVEERKRKNEAPENRLGAPHKNIEEIQQASLSHDFEYILDSNGRRIDYDNPKVVHIHTDITNRFTSCMVYTSYEKHGLKCRLIGRVSPEMMQYARKVCSGRECIPMTAMTGAIVNDIQNRRDSDEISVYFTLDQEGPCQNGAWPIIWKTFGRRLKLENVIWGVNRNMTQNHLGLKDPLLREINNAVFLGDFFEEAQNALKCAALDKETAIDRFYFEFNRFNESLGKGKPLEEALEVWALKVAEIPLGVSIDNIPKVLIFGGLNLIFVHYPVTEYFIQQGIIPKVVDVAEGACWLESEDVSRYGFKHGFITPSEQLSCSPPRKNKKEAVKARKSRFGLKRIDTLQKKFRKIMETSGLLFDHHTSFPEIMEEGHKYVSYNGFTETTVTTGRYVCSEKDRLYDGFINLGSFNCQPAMNSQAIIRPLANASDVPYVALDCEGPWISANQRRLLEAVVVQAKRLKDRKNASEDRSCLSI